MGSKCLTIAQVQEKLTFTLVCKTHNKLYHWAPLKQDAVQLASAKKEKKKTRFAKRRTNYTIATRVFSEHLTNVHKNNQGTKRKVQFTGASPLCECICTLCLGSLMCHIRPDKACSDVSRLVWRQKLKQCSPLKL